MFGFGKKEKDLVCGMDVNPKTASFKAEHDGKTYCFCSEGCMKQFVESPAKFVK